MSLFIKDITQFTDSPEKIREYSWAKNSAFLFSMIKNIYKFINIENLDPKLKEQFDFVINENHEWFTLYTVNNINLIEFLKAAKKAQAWQKKVGKISFDGNSLLFDDYLKDCDRLIRMIEKEIENRRSNKSLK